MTEREEQINRMIGEFHALYSLGWAAAWPRYRSILAEAERRYPGAPDAP